MKYYKLVSSPPPNTLFADTFGETPLAHDLLPDLLRASEVPFPLRLKKMSWEGNSWVPSDRLSGDETHWLDYQPNTLAWILLSERCKNILVSFLKSADLITWLPVSISDEQEVRTYFIPRFDQKPDILDEKNSVYDDELALYISMKFDREKVANFPVFVEPDMFWEIPTSIIVSEEVRDKLVTAKVTGLEFSPFTI